MSIWDVLKKSPLQFLREKFQKQPTMSFPIGRNIQPTPQQTLQLGRGPISSPFAQQIQAQQAQEVVRKPSFLPERTNIVVEAVRAIPRTLTSFALPLAGKETIAPQGMTPIQRKVLGIETVKAPGTRIFELAQTIAGITKQKKPSLPTFLAAGIGIAGSSVLDTYFSGGGKPAKLAAKGILREIEKAAGKEIAEKVAKDVARETAKAYAKKTTARSEALQIIRNKYIPRIKPLAQEARKDNVTLYRASPTLPDKGSFKKEYSQKELDQAVEDGAAEGVAKALRESQNKYKERGFVTSVKEVLPEIKVAGQYVPRSTDRLATKASNLIKSDIATAEKMAQGTDDNAIAVTAELLKHYNEQASLAADQTIKDALYQKAADLANIKARQLTELGRSVQAASILGRLTPEGQVKFAVREIQKYNEGIEEAGTGLFGLKKKIPELIGEQERQIVEQMKTIQGMADGTEKAMKFQKLQNYITDLVPTPLTKKIISVWKAGLLTGIKTTGLNIFSNVSHGVIEIVKDVPTAMVDKFTSIFTKKRTAPFSLKGIFSGGKEGMGKGWQYLRTGFDERNIGTKLDYKRLNFGKGRIAKGLQAYTDSVFRVLGTEDQPFYYAIKLRSLYSQAKAVAINKGLKGKPAQSFIDDLIQNPTEEIIKYASLDAETAVFQNKTLLGRAAKKIQQIPGGEVIVPFGRTPSAVAMQILNYSPVGIAKTIVKNIGKGRFDQRLFSQGMGRGLTGTAVLFLGGLLMSKNMMTLDSPKSEKERELWKLEGKKANAIYDPITKKWRSAQILGPAGNVLLIGGHFKKAFKESGSPSEAMANALAGSIKSFSEQTFLTGVSNFVEVVLDPARSAEYVAASTFASTIPTIVSDIARATDTKERRVNTIIEKFQARIPGVRETLEPQISTMGEERETIGNPLEVMIDPTRPSPEKSSPVVTELRQLWDAGYKVSPTLLGDKKGYDGLTPKQNTDLWKKAGEITNQKLGNLFKNEKYQVLADDEKSKVVEDFVDKAKLAARVLMVIELTADLQGDGLKAKLSELKKSSLLTREVFDNYLKMK